MRGRRDTGKPRAGGDRAEQLATLPHLGRGERFQHCGGFRPAREHGQAALQHGDPRSRREVVPHVAGPQRAAPHSCPVTVTKPKLRIEAPTLRASRSTTTTRKPRRAAANAWASPMIPAPTTAKS